jgi:hypothetical protein
MRHPISSRAPRRAIVWTLSALFAMSLALAGGTTALAADADTIAIVTGGGTVFVNGTNGFIASFGINGKRPVGFVSGGSAVGRINYDKHLNDSASVRHINVPVVAMAVVLSATPSANGTGGSANLYGDCTALGAECEGHTTGFAFVYADDNSDNGSPPDMFKITYCSGAMPSPLPNVTPNPPGGAGCAPLDGGNLRSGNIQIRPAPTGTVQAPTMVRTILRMS